MLFRLLVQGSSALKFASSVTFDGDVVFDGDVLFTQSSNVTFQGQVQFAQPPVISSNMSAPQGRGA
jgi:hypothetical protein